MASDEANLREKLSLICRRFQRPGELIRYRRISQGNINTAYCVALRDEGGVRQYFVQRINRHVFPDPAAMMENIDRITRHLRDKAPADAARTVLRFHRTAEGAGCLRLGRGPEAEFWRLCDFIENAVTFEAGEGDARVLGSAGRAFGRFARQLRDFDPAQLTETIPHFHDTPYRLRALFDAAEADPLGRARHAAEELGIIRAHQGFAQVLCRQAERGDLPLRVTHNDTKTNNVLFDRDTLAPLAVIDLDTCMPGLICHDFGDAVRFAACTADGADPVSTKIDLARFRAFTEGYLAETRDFLTPAELDALAAGAAVITLELAARFLADYLLGDPYFRVDGPARNLRRARGQLALYLDMRKRMEEMGEIVRECARGGCAGNRIHGPRPEETEEDRQ